MTYHSLFHQPSTTSFLDLAGIVGVRQRSILRIAIGSTVWKTRTLQHAHARAWAGAAEMYALAGKERIYCPRYG